MKCVKCGTEYEGNECPRCNGPVIKINSSDYMARRKAYEESLARKETQKVLDSAEEAGNVLSGESEQSDKDGKTIQQGKRVKKRSHKVKNYDEGVFDITKVDFNDVAVKLKEKPSRKRLRPEKIIMLRRIIMLRQIIILRRIAG